MRVASLSACSALAVAGCGGKPAPKLDRADAAPLIAVAHRIPHDGAAARARDVARLQRRVIALINAGRVPDALQEPLSSDANALVLAPATRARDLEAWLKKNSG